jgi:hypothetical protein
MLECPTNALFEMISAKLKLYREAADGVGRRRFVWERNKIRRQVTQASHQVG